ncbi:MAG: helix-turn-helix domain-containing protein [Parvularculaceae bacterium]
MANNVRRLRVAFLLTPSDFARRLRADPIDVERMEAAGYRLTPEWIEAVARALGVSPETVTDPNLNLNALTGKTPPAQQAPPVCPVATRYAILALTAKFAGLKFARDIDDDSLARAVLNFFAFVESADEPGRANDLTRQKRALQIAVLTILQARGFVPGPTFETELQDALPGAMEMMRRFAAIDGAPAGG